VISFPGVVNSTAGSRESGCCPSSTTKVLLADPVDDVEVKVLDELDVVVELELEVGVLVDVVGVEEDVGELVAVVLTSVLA
jgi:hypothetical protein